MRKGITVVRAHGLLFACVLFAALAMTGGGVFAVLGAPPKGASGGKTTEAAQTARELSPAAAVSLNQRIRQVLQEQPDVAEAMRVTTSESTSGTAAEKRTVNTSPSAARPAVQKTGEAGAASAEQTPSAVTPESFSAHFSGVSMTPAVAERLRCTNRMMRVVPTADAGDTGQAELPAKRTGLAKNVKISKSSGDLLSGLSMAADYSTMCQALGVVNGTDPALLEAIDINDLTSDGDGSAEYFQANGIPDLAELLLLETALKNSSFDLGGITNAALVDRWNEIEAQLVLGEGVTSVDPSIVRMAIAYCMLGNTGSSYCGAMIAVAAGLVPVDDNAIDVLFIPMPWPFSQWGDLDNDGFSNLLEWQETANIGSGEGEGEGEGEPTFTARSAAYNVSALGAGQQPSGTFYTVSFTQTGPGVTTYPAELKYKSGTSATLWAFPRYPWKFTGWTVNGTLHQENPLVLTAAATVHVQYDTDPTASLYFDDPRLEQAVRVLINKLSGPILWSDVMGDSPLTTLDASGLGITDLDGLEQLISLTSLNLYDNNIVRIVPVCDLSTLTELNLGRNRISNAAPLAGLVNLRSWK
jgi:hypothetical protein